MLGVRRDADARAIRDAYWRLARELHPDAIADRSPSGQAAAQERMAEINDAFATLGDPDRRRAYDTRWRAPTSARATTPGAPTTSTSAAAHDSWTASPTAALARTLPWLALAALLVGIFVFTAYAGGGGEDGDARPGDDTPATVAVRDLRGSCLQRSGGFLLVVNCGTTPHEGRIVAQASLGASCPEGTVEWEVRQEDVLVCTDPATAVP